MHFSVILHDWWNFWWSLLLPISTPKLCFFSWFDFAPCCSSNTHLYREVASLLGWYDYFFICYLGILFTSLFSCSESSQKCIKVIKYFKYFHCYFQNKNCSSWLCMNFRTNFSFHGINFYSREFFKETNRIFSHFSSLVLPTNLGHVFQCCLQFQNVSVSLLQKACLATFFEMSIFWGERDNKKDWHFSLIENLSKVQSQNYQGQGRRFGNLLNVSPN